MKKKMKNETHIEGYIYENKLELKVTGENSKNPGTEFISGTLGIATDDEMLNVVQVHFTYVTAVTSSGKPNQTFNILQSIINGKMGNVLEHGKENASKLRIDSAIGLNEWYDDRTQGSPLVSVKRNEGGFVHQTQELNPDLKARATFNTDMLITGAVRHEADEERNLPEKVVVKGYVFNFRNDLLPVEFSVWSPAAPAGALDYFENLGATPNTPIFTRVQGEQISKTVTRAITEENAFGEPIVKTIPSTQRDFVITWALPGGYEWDSEDTILASELAELISNREVALAEMKKRQDEYKATKGNALASGSKSTATTPAKGNYQF